MTEASENGCGYLVRVRAQVMCRDEQAEGWVGLSGGGLADVRVGKRRATHKGESKSDKAPAFATSHEYYIHGTRISDNMVVLECTIKKDFHYNKVMPTFHHWVTDGQRFGLTFQTAADARAFDKGVRAAVEELLEGLDGAWPSLHAYKERNPGPKDDDEDQNIFEDYMNHLDTSHLHRFLATEAPEESPTNWAWLFLLCLDLPCSSRSSSENSSASRLRTTDKQTPILCAIALPTHHGEAMKCDAVSYHHRNVDEKHGETDPERYPYVHLTAVHDYNYPQVGPGGIITSEKSSPNTKPPLLKRDSGSLKKCSYSDPPPLPKKPTDPFQSRVKCRHCHEWYLESANRPGSCEYAPDCMKSCIDCVTCIKCPQCMIYHCMSDGEGDFAMHPCECGPPDEQCAKRWIGITLLSILIPCLCCYAPLRCAHAAAARAHLAGGLHSPLH